MQWYYALNNASHGPVSQEQFDAHVKSGTITPETLVWHDGMPAWLPWGRMAGAPGADSDSAVCAVSGKVFPKREMLEYNGQWISAEHKDEFFQRIREGLPQEGEMHYVGFWFRFLAKIIDGVCLWVGMLLVSLVTNPLLMWAVNPEYHEPGAFQPARFFLVFVLVWGLNMSVAIAYNIFFIRKFDATPGKLAIGARLVRSDGGKLSIGRIVGRYFAEMASSLILCIGYMMAGWDSEKRALHDHMCDTRVIKK